MHEGETRSGKKHGPWVWYYASGSIQREGTYDDGLKVGRWLQYWPNGKLRSRVPRRPTAWTSTRSSHY